MLRFAWHSSGTYDRYKHDGGSTNGTMRFDKEVTTKSNTGLARIRTWIEPIRNQFPWISYGDLATLGGVTAVQELGGPTIKWRPGRVDGGENKIPPDGRLLMPPKVLNTSAICLEREWVSLTKKLLL